MRERRSRKSKRDAKLEKQRRDAEQRSKRRPAFDNSLALSPPAGARSLDAAAVSYTHLTLPTKA